MWSLPLLLLALSLSPSSCIVLQPPENQFVVSGASAVLVCTSSSPIRSCAWSTPAGKTYVLEEGLAAEKGRLRYTSTDPTRECGLAISDFDAARDSGVWSCGVNVVEDGELVSAEGQAHVHEASRPSAVALAEPYHSDRVNVSKSLGPVRCVVSGAKPKPTFAWYLDEERLTDFETVDSSDESGAEAAETLLYQPQLAHANGTLRCVVQHVALEEGGALEASVKLLFQRGDEEFILTLEEDYTNSFVHVVVAAVVTVFIVGLIVSGCIVYHKVCRRKQGDLEDKDDEEAGRQEEEEMEKETNEEKPISGDDETEDKKTTLRERFTTYFRILNELRKEGTEEEEEEEKEEKEEEANAENKNEEEETKEADDGKGKSSSDSGVSDDGTTEEEVEEDSAETKTEPEADTAARTSKQLVTRLMKVFRKKPKASEEEAEEGGDGSEEVEVSEEEKAKQDEQETEKKEEQEKEGEKKGEEEKKEDEEKRTD